MIRLCLSFFSVFLITTTVWVAYLRRSEVDDSLSFLLITQDHQSSQILRIKLNGQQTELFNAPRGAQVLYAEWSPNGQWLLITLIYPNHPQRIGEIYRVDWTGTDRRLVYRTDYIVQGAHLSPNGAEFALTRWHNKDNRNQKIYVIRVDMRGNELQRYEFEENNNGNRWDLVWNNQQTIILNNLTESKLYQINTVTQATTVAEKAFLFTISFPDGEWQTIFRWGESSIQRQRFDSPETSVNIIDLPNEHILNYRFSDDRQWVGVVAMQASLNHLYFAPADLYLIKYDGTQLQKLVKDNYFKSFLPFDTGEPRYFQSIGTSFSPNNKWLAYYSLTQNPFGFYVHVVRLDNPQQIRSNLYSGNDVIRNTYVQWQPYISHQASLESPFHFLGLLLIGLVLLLTNPGLSIWQGRRQSA